MAKKFESKPASVKLNASTTTTTLKASKKAHKAVKKSVTEVKKPSVITTLPEEPSDGPKLHHTMQGAWKKFSHRYLIANEEMDIGVSYMGLNAASVKVRVLKNKRISGKDVYVFSARAKTASFYSWVYELDDYIQSFVLRDTFVPVKYSLIQRESKKDIDHLEFFDRDKLKTHFRYKRTKKSGAVNYRKKDSSIPYFSQDFLSVFFFFRGLPLKPGDSYIIPITTKAKTWEMKINVLKRENVSVKYYKNAPALKVEAITKYSGELAKQGKLHFWISDDKYRVLMKFKASVKIGSIKGSLLKYRVDGQEILK